jgi:hypothetical protein
MLFGHNTDVKLGETVYHVQTEDRGTATALIETTVHCRGRVLHRRTNNYNDLLPLDAERERALQKRVDEQHSAVIEEVRSGALHLEPPPPPPAPPPKKRAARQKAGPAGGAKAHPAEALSLQLLNATSWLEGKRAHLQILVRRTQNGMAAAGATVMAQVDGAAQATEFAGRTGEDGIAQLEFEMPQLAAAEAALIFHAVHGNDKGQLKFHLRSKPRSGQAVAAERPGSGK